MSEVMNELPSKRISIWEARENREAPLSSRISREARNWLEDFGVQLRQGSSPDGRPAIFLNENSKYIVDLDVWAKLLPWNIQKIPWSIMISSDTLLLDRTASKWDGFNSFAHTLRLESKNADGTTDQIVFRRK